MSPAAFSFFSGLATYRATRLGYEVERPAAKATVSGRIGALRMNWKPIFLQRG